MTWGSRFLTSILILVLFGTGCSDETFTPQFNVVAQADIDLAVEVTTQTVFDLAGINGVVVVTGSDSGTQVTITAHASIVAGR